MSSHTDDAKRDTGKGDLTMRQPGKLLLAFATLVLLMLLCSLPAFASAYSTIEPIPIPRIYQANGGYGTDCYVCSVASVQAYYNGGRGYTYYTYGNKDTESTRTYSRSKEYGWKTDPFWYKIYKLNGNSAFMLNSTIANLPAPLETKTSQSITSSSTLSFIYNQLKIGNPVIIHYNDGNGNMHASVIVGYKGNGTSTLNTDNFIVMEIKKWNSTDYTYSTILKNWSSNLYTYANSKTFWSNNTSCFITLKGWLYRSFNVTSASVTLCYHKIPTTYTVVETMEKQFEVVKNGSHVLESYYSPYGNSQSPMIKKYTAGDIVNVVASVKNTSNGIWYKLEDGTFMWKGILKEFQAIPTEPTAIEAPEQITMDVGDRVKIDWALLPEGVESMAVSFATSNAGICSVDEEGTVTGVNIGQATITLSTDNGVSTQVAVDVHNNIEDASILFNGENEGTGAMHLVIVQSEQDVPYEFRYTVSNGIDPGYDVRFTDDGYDDTLSWTDKQANDLVRFSGYGLIRAAFETPITFWTWGNVLVTNEAVSCHIPASTTAIESEAFSGTGATFFYLPDSVRTIAAHAFPKGAYVFLNTQALESIDMLEGDEIRYVETCGAFNESFYNRANALGTEAYYLPNGISVPEYWSAWSDWTAVESDPSEDLQVESKLQYRSAPVTIEQQLSDWSEWSKWSSTRQTITDPTFKEEDTRTLYQYYFFECSGCGAHMPFSTKCLTDLGGCGKSSGTVTLTWNQGKWLTTTKSQCNIYTSGNTTRYWTTSSGKKYYLYTDATDPSMVQYRYHTREYVPVEVIGEYSEWTDNYIEETEGLSVEVRTLFRTRQRISIR